MAMDSMRKYRHISEQWELKTALRQVWDLKKELRAQVKAERAVKAALVRQRFSAKSVEGLTVCHGNPQDSGNDSREHL